MEHQQHHPTDLLRQDTDADLILVWFGPQLNLSQDLVGEGVAHDEAGVAGSTAKVHQPPFGKEDDVGPSGEGVPVHLGKEGARITTEEKFLCCRR